MLAVFGYLWLCAYFCFGLNMGRSSSEDFQPQNRKVLQIHRVMRLILHLVIGWCLEVIILILIILLRELLGSLHEVDLTSTRASSIGDDVVGIDLLHVVVIGLIN